MIFPIININGTSERELLEDYDNAFVALEDAIKAVLAIEFNARDYGRNWEKALEQREKEIKLLDEIKENMRDHILAIIEQRRK